MVKTSSVFLLTDPGLLSQYINIIVPQTNVHDLFVRRNSSDNIFFYLFIFIYFFIYVFFFLGKRLLRFLNVLEIG